MGLSEGLTVALPKCIFRAAENDDPVGVSVSVSTVAMHPYHLLCGQMSSPPPL